MKTLMILGGSILQLPAIKKAKELGLNVIVLDINPDAVGFKEEGIIGLQISTIDTNRVIEAAERYNIDGIMTLASDVPMPTIAKVCQKLGLPGISPQTALNATNKAEMRNCFKEHHVPIPEFYVAENEKEFIEFTKHIKDKFIIKPADNSGNRGIKLVSMPLELRELKEVYKYSKQYSKDGRILLEEYMEGEEFSVESISINGVCHVIQITDKITSGEPYFVEIGHTQPSKYNQTVKTNIAETAQLGVNALGIMSGPSHTEIKLTKEGPKIVEIGARLGGGCITTHLVPLSTGVDMVKANILIALGEMPDLSPRYEKAAAIRFFRTPSGLFKGVEGVEEAKKMPGVIEIGFFKQIGEYIPPMRNGLDRVGYVITQRDNRNSAVELCEEILRKIHFNIE